MKSKNWQNSVLKLTLSPKKSTLNLYKFDWANIPPLNTLHHNTHTNPFQIWNAMNSARDSHSHSSLHPPHPSVQTHGRKATVPERQDRRKVSPISGGADSIPEGDRFCPWKGQFGLGRALSESGSICGPIHTGREKEWTPATSLGVPLLCGRENRSLTWLCGIVRQGR